MKTSFSTRAMHWCCNCFGIRIAHNHREATLRFLEEALELAQSCDLTDVDAHNLVDYVFNREKGEVKQEVGGLMVCLHRLSVILSFDPDECAEVELMRCWTKVDKIREKRFLKPAYIKQD